MSIEHEEDINLTPEEQEEEDKPSLLDVLADIAEVISCFVEVLCLLLGKGD
jgi:hypothetical protein